jgi:ribosome biogenesis GTPase
MHLRVASFRKSLDRLSIAPGDMVRAKPLDDDRALIDERLERRSAVTRTTGGGRTRTMAANVDTMAIVAAFARPTIHLAMIDELIAFAELHDLEALPIFTKPDLAESENDVERICAIYRAIGYRPLVVNPKTGLNVTELTAELAARSSLLIGQSGVGKSSIFRSLGGTGTIGELSKIGRGKQTTTASRLHRFSTGFLIDSPGVGEFELRDLSWGEAAEGFVEFGPLAESCRFRDCSHREEPACAVRLAAEDGRIAASRYASYREMVDRA